jgi:hypothetical protein
MRWGTLMAVTDSLQDAAPVRTLAALALPARVRSALQNQLQTAVAELTRQLQVVLGETAIELGRQAERMQDHVAQRAMFDALRRLRGAEADFTARFARDLEASLAQLQAPRVPRRLEELAAPAQGLSLVETVEMDEGSVLGSIAARSDSRNSLALQLLGCRYGVLAGAPAFDAEHLPLGPQALCHAVRDACDAFELPMAARVVLYTQFEKVAMAHYPSLLETLNARLVGDGVLPHLSFVPVRVRPATPGVERAQAPATPTRVAAPPTPLVADLEPLSLDADAAPPSTPAKPISPDREGTFAALRGMLARRRALLTKLRPGEADARSRESLPQGDVLAGLRRMRVADGKQHGSLADVRQTLLAQARQRHGHGVALSEVDGDVFELLSLHLGQLQRELRAGSPGEALVERLQLPLLQLALRDHDVFIHATHPARMLLDAVSLAGARWLADDDLDAQWLGLLQRAVAIVLEDADAERDTFVAANHALQSGLQAAARKLEMGERRQVEAARGREKLELARRRAHDEIAGLAAGRGLPRFNMMLLEQAWLDVLSLALLRGGEDSPAWRNLHEATAAIVEASARTDARTPDPALVAQVQEALGQVGYHAEDAGAIARQLANGRAEDADLASRTELIVQLKARARLGEENVARVAASRAPRDAAEQAAHDTLSALDGSHWIDLQDDADDRVTRRRLAWLGPTSGHALILNRRGIRVAEHHSLDTLARQLAAGRLRRVERDAPPAETAWQATLANLQRMTDREDADGR